MHENFVARWAWGVALGWAMAMTAGHAETSAFGVDPDTGLATAVVVEDKAIAHTMQLLPVDASGAVVGDTLDAQLAQVVKNIATVLGEVGAGLDTLARLNVFVAEDGQVAEVESLLRRHLGSESHPAVTSVVARVHHPSGAPVLVSADAIAAVADAQAPASVLRHTSSALPARNGVAHVAVLPKGRALYISGMAEQDTDDLVEASKGTMEQLHGVLALNDLTAEHVVHLKAYMKPAEGVSEAEQAMAAFYPDAAAPPMTFVDWLNGIPTEIELIAWAPGEGDGAEPVVHLWPPDVTPSPVYCRYSIVSSPTRIYTKGFTAGAAVDADAQVHHIFGQLEAALGPLGSDFRHMVKATYYVTEDGTSTALNQIRPSYYDPEHPPAASKATVAGSGDGSRGLVLDMIAVPR